MRVVPVPVLNDNYAFVLESNGRAAVVDPGEAEPVLELLERERLTPTTVLLTHHHRDHVGGVAPIVRRFPGLPVVGAERDRRRLPELSRAVREGDAVTVLDRDARVLEVPGHTSGHVAYFFAGDTGGGELFSGDTVFGGTIGNLFEGTPDDMFGSLVKIRALPEATRLWCAHEYTLQYVRVAARFDPTNRRLAERLRRLEAAGDGAVTVPLTLEEERATSPFFRWDDPDLAARLGTRPGIETFRRLCEVL
jgi:hydroxyacylglutathione hydrolase